MLTDAGTPYIYCVGGSAATQATATDRVFRYNPVTDVISPVASPWPGAMGTILPGGFSVFNNKLYILGGFNNPVGMVDTIYEFTPNPAGWVRKMLTCQPRAVIYPPPPSATSSTPGVAACSIPSRSSSIRLIHLDMIPWLIPSSPLPAYPGQQPRRER